METKLQEKNRVVTSILSLTEHFSLVTSCISIYVFFLLYINIHSLPDILLSKSTIISLVENKSFNIAYNILFIFIIYIAFKLKNNINYVKQDVALDISVYCCSFIITLGILIHQQVKYSITCLSLI